MRFRKKPIHPSHAPNKMCPPGVGCLKCKYIRSLEYWLRHKGKACGPKCSCCYMERTYGDRIDNRDLPTVWLKLYSIFLEF